MTVQSIILKLKALEEIRNTYIQTELETNLNTANSCLLVTSINVNSESKVPSWLNECPQIKYLLYKTFNRYETVNLRKFLIYIFNSDDYKYFTFLNPDNENISDEEYNNRMIPKYIENLYELDSNKIVYKNNAFSIQVRVFEFKRFIELIVEHKLYSFVMTD